jgi:hypothetical protein
MGKTNKGSPRSEARSYLGALGYAAASLAALGALFLLPYRVNDFVYPVGYDALHYVWRADVTAALGLDSIGTVRAGTPLLLATLMGLTGENGFTLLVVAPAILAGVAGLGAAAMIRAGLGVGAVYVPFLAVMAWVGFGRIGIIGGHTDNLLNAALVLPAFGAACATVAGGGGAAAVALLLSGAALAHWPFYLYASAILLFALATFVLLQLRMGERSLTLVGRLLAAVGASGVVAALTFLAPPPQGGTGVHFPSALLRERFLKRLRMPVRYPALPLALPGAVVLSQSTPSRTGPPARRLLLCLLLAWVASVVAGGIAQFFGIPVAGARLLEYFFAIPLLAGVFFVWVAGILSRRGHLGVAVAALLLFVVLGAFGRMAWEYELTRHPWVQPRAMKQVAAAGTYLSRDAPEGEVVFLLSRHRDETVPGQRWRVLRASLPPDQISRARWFLGLPDEYLAQEDGDPPGDSADQPVVIVVSGYNPEGFRQAVALGAPVPAPGVAVLKGPLPGVIPEVTVPQADTSLGSLAQVGSLVALLLFLAGSGWSAALLPPDPVVRVILAPALGTAVLTLLALGWDRFGLGLGGLRAAGPLALSFSGGWALVAVKRWRLARGSAAERSESQENPV